MPNSGCGLKKINLNKELIVISKIRVWVRKVPNYMEQYHNIDKLLH